MRAVARRPMRGWVVVGGGGGGVCVCVCGVGGGVGGGWGRATGRHMNCNHV